MHKFKAMITFSCLSVIGCGDEGQTAADNSINELEETVGRVSEDSAFDASPSESLQSLSGPQANAVRSAKQYLDMAGFSRDGLIQQLTEQNKRLEGKVLEMSRKVICRTGRMRG